MPADGDDWLALEEVKMSLQERKEVEKNSDAEVLTSDGWGVGILLVFCYSF